MASAEREPITGVWGQSPQRGPRAEPLVGAERNREENRFLTDTNSHDITVISIQ